MIIDLIIFLKKIDHLNFKPSFTIEDGVFELVNKFKSKKLTDTLNKFYLNIKRTEH